MMPRLRQQDHILISVISQSYAGRACGIWMIWKGCGAGIGLILWLDLNARWALTKILIEDFWL